MAVRPLAGRPGPLVVVLGLLAGCATPPALDRASVSDRVAGRFGASVGWSDVPADRLVPAGLDLGKPLPEDQAVLVALWNNAAFQEALVELQLTRADLVQAGLLPNPEFIYYWPAEQKPFKYLIDFPIESLYLRPVRLKVAAAENARACEKVTQLALDLIRDTRQAYFDLRLARERAVVADAGVKLRGRIAELAEARLKDGDVSEQEVTTARIDGLTARQDAARIRFETTLAEERLRFLLGLGGYPCALVPEAAANAGTPVAPPDADELAREATTTRPDALAADAAIAAATERLQVAQVGWFRFLGILDATSGRRSGHELSGAIRFTVPIFNRGQGVISRAEADLEQLVRRRMTVHNQIILDVRLAHARYEQTRAEYDVLTTKVRPEVDAAVGRAQKAYQAGALTYLLALEATRQRLDADNRQALLRADLQRNWADLERGVGRRLPRTPTPPPGPTP